jgi:hypothetical protein
MPGEVRGEHLHKNLSRCRAKKVNGSADAAASVTVNGGAVSRQGEYYRQQVSVNNRTTALVQWLTSRATNTTGTSIVARLSFVPERKGVSPALFNY